MPIEFRCTKCGKLLRSPDETAGKQARCPECGTVLPIPAGVAPITPVVAPLLGASATPVSEAVNPYQSPAITEGHAATGLIRHSLTFEAAYVHTWRVFVHKAPMCFAAVVLVTVVNLAFVVAEQYVAAFGVPAVVLWTIAKTLIQLWLSVGMVGLFLKLARGESTGIAEIFSGSPLVPTAYTRGDDLVRSGHGHWMFVLPGARYRRGFDVLAVHLPGRRPKQRCA